MADLQSIKKNWLRPFFFYGNNRLSLVGGALTSASALVLVGFWIVDVLGHGGSNNPYLGLIVDVALPGLFILGLLLIPAGIWLRQRGLMAAGQIPSVYPNVDLRDPAFRHGIEFVLIATFINFVIVGTAAYRGVAYMDQPSFCGETCHVMQPEWQAYHVSSHQGVACTECHIAPGIAGFVHAKVNGTKQLAMVVLHQYPTPIMAEGKIPAANLTCLNCHNANREIGDKMLVKSTYGDDEKNSLTRTVAWIHVGGIDAAGAANGIHGAHMAHIEYVATDSGNQTIPWVTKTNADRSVDEFDSPDAKAAMPGKRHVMDCIDCHNRAAHSFDTAEQALNKQMAVSTSLTSLPFLHKQGLALIKADYKNEDDAAAKIDAGLQQFYRSQYPAVWSSQKAQIDQASRILAKIYAVNIFPFMKVTWGSHPNNLGHNDYPGCFRCHDGSHNTKGGTSITNDCTTCHNLVAVDEADPKKLAALGVQ